MNLPVGYYLQNGKYQILQIVGQGGFGITYKGVLFTEVKGQLGTIKTDVPISIKEYFFKDYCYRNTDTYSVNIHSETGNRLFDKFKEKLIKEAKILSDVRHPNIVSVLDVFEENNTAYIAMEFISGHSLKYMLEKKGALPEEKALKYICQIGRALHFVHEKNILHLDIKPSNILIDQNDNAYLIDFGVSKRYDVEDDKETSTTVLTLSKGFASIEQYDNEGTQTFSPCPDIYSLGATLYNLLTGKVPTESILRATRPLRSPSEFNPKIAEKTELAILKAMQIEPDSRFQSVKEMLDSLDIPPFVEKTSSGNYERLNPSDTQDETTLFYSSLPVTGKKEDNEKTLLMDEPVNKTKTGKKKKRNLILSLIGMFVLIGSFAAFLLGHDKPVPDEILTPPVISVDPKDDDPKDGEQKGGENIQLATPVQNTPAGSEIIPTQVDPTDKPGVNTDTNLTVLLTDEEINEKYAELIKHGKIKLQANDPKGAHDDFLEAWKIKESDEAKDFISDANVKMYEKEIADKLALYEEKFIFGKLKIVRKKLSNKYGAVDEKGEEIIQCIYPYVEKREEGWAFQREDGLYDIYGADGNLLQNVGTY